MKETYETEKYVIEYSEKDKEYIEEILVTLDNKSKEIMNFFKLEKLSSKVKIVIWDSIEGYKNNILPYLEEIDSEYKEWMIADTMDGNINMLPIRLVNNTDYNITGFSDTIRHEFVHICHRQARKERNVKFCHSDTWFWEVLATNLGNIYPEEIMPIETTIDKLEKDFDNVDGNYDIAYTIGQYLFENYEKDYIYELAIDNDKLEKKGSILFDNAKEWSRNKTRSK